MAWTSKFSGLPTIPDIVEVGDTYLAGVFTIAGDGLDRTMQWGNSPLAYETLASLGASISNVLRVTARLSSIVHPITSGYGLGGGPILYGPDRTDQSLGWGDADGFWSAYATENGVNALIGNTAEYTGGPWTVRIYWNGTASAFIIPDAGFGSWSIASNTQSVWYSPNDGVSWTRIGDRAIAAGVAPTRVGFGAVRANLGDKDIPQFTFTSLEVMEEGESPNPYLENKSPVDGGSTTDPDVLISVDIKDPQNDIDLSTLNVTVDVGSGPVAAYTAGVGFVSPYNGPSSSLTPITDGYTLVLDRTSSFPIASITTRVVVEDLLGNPLDDSWSFSLSYLIDHTLWAIGGGNELHYSFDEGGIWIHETSIPGGSHGLAGLWGPKTAWKVYIGVGLSSTYVFDGSWTLEDPNGPWAYTPQVRPDDPVIWCSKNDSIVVAVGSYGDDAVIRTRPGPPGTAWVTEFYDSDSNYGTFNCVHGTPDGSAIFAIRSYVGSTADDVELLKRNPNGTWSVVASITDGNSWRWQQVRVISETEVWITGGYYVSGTDLVARIWKWNGSTLSVEYEDTDIRARGIVGLWMAEDGSEGWAMYQVNGPSSETDYYLRYNGSSWSVDQGVQYGRLSSDVTQRDGIPTSAIGVLSDSSIRRYDGADWDDTYAPTRDIWANDNLLLLLRYIESQEGDPPEILNISPAPGTESFNRGSPIQFDAVDVGSGINVDATEVTLNGDIIWSADAPAVGYSGSRQAIANGWRYRINKDGGWLPGTYYGAEFYIEDAVGNSDFDTTWFVAAYEPVTGRVWLRTITRKLIRATFNRDVIVEDALDPDKYAIELISESGQEVQILGIQGNDPDGNGETRYVDILLTRPTLGSDYKITVSGLRTSNGKIIESAEGYIRGRLTKTDSILDKLAELYDVDLTNSVLAHVLIGVGISDDIIGAGENDYDVIALAETGVGSSTYGTATFGTNTFGG